MHQETERYDKVYKSDVILLPHIKIASTQLQTTDDIVLKENKLTSPFKREEDLVLTFLFNGEIKSVYQGINPSFNNRESTWTLIYAPFENDHYVRGGQLVDSLTMGINKTFLRGLMQEEDPWMDGILNQIEKRQPFSMTKLTGEITPEMFRILKQIRNSKGVSNSMKTLYLQSKASELIFLHLTETSVPASTKFSSSLSRLDTEKLQGLKSYIDQHYLESLTLEFLARLVGLNSFKLKTGFRCLYQKSVFEYVRELRMQHALNMLLDGQHTVTEVAYMLGYEHVQHFSTAFKKHFGRPPGEYKVLF